MAAAQILDLDDGSLSNIFRALDSVSRANCALVCHLWNEVEQTFPAQPTMLCVEGKDCNPSFVSWHLRDIHRLTDLRLRPPSNDTLEVQCHLINHIAVSSPALACVVFRPPGMPPGHTQSWNQMHVGPLPRCLLPVLGQLGQLMELVLHSWSYTAEELGLIGSLSSLQNLRAFGLQDVRADLRLANPVDILLENRLANAAGRVFQELLMGLGNLTELRVEVVDFQRRLLPQDAETNWSSLRSLVLNSGDMGIDRFEWRSGPLRLQGMSNLESLRVSVRHCHQPLVLADLVSLQDLTYDNKHSHQPLSLGTAIQLTRLKINQLLGWSVPTATSRSLLPLTALKSLKELEMGARFMGDFPPEFSALTALTKIDLRLGQSYVPEVLLGMTGLRDVAVTMFDFSTHQLHDLIRDLPSLICLTSHSPATKHIYQLVRDLPRLTRLVAVSCMEEGAHWALITASCRLHEEAERVARLFDTAGRLKMEVKLVGMSKKQMAAAYSGGPVQWYEYGRGTEQAQEEPRHHAGWVGELNGPWAAAGV